MKVQMVRLGDILTPRGGSAVIPSEQYSIAGVFGFGRGVLRRESIAGFQTKYKTLTRLNAGDVVYSKLKAFEGAVTTVDTESDGYWVSPEFPVFSVSSDVSARYLDHALRSSAFQSSLTSLSTGIGARRERVHPTQFLSIEIPLPSRPDQDRIAAHLDSIARAQSSAGSPSLAGLTRRDWDGDVFKVADLVDPVVRAETVDPDAIYEMSGVRWYGDGLFVRETKLGRDLSAKQVRRIEVGDLVYNRLFAWKQSFAVAGYDGTASNEFPTFRINEDQVRPRVLLAALLSPNFTAAVNEASTGSTPTSRNRLKERDFLALSVTIPRLALQPAVERALQTADHAAILRARETDLSSALLPAARNEIFGALIAKRDS